MSPGRSKYANVVGSAAASEEVEGDSSQQVNVENSPLSHTVHRKTCIPLQSCRWCHLSCTCILMVVCVFLAWLLYMEKYGNTPNKESSSSWALLPTPDTVISRVVWGSCAQQQFAQPFWDTILDLNPSLFIFAGDTVYGDCRSKDCSELSLAFERLQNKPSFAGAKSLLPMITVWDDHDYGLNDGSASNPFKDRAKDIFMDFFSIAMDDERRSRNGLYISHLWGQHGRMVQIILLDTRWFRSEFSSCDSCNGRYKPDNDSSKTMLGEEQWSWLQEQLREVADVRLIVSTIQVVADGHNWEGWLMLPRERKRLYELLSGATGTSVILSGDRHVGGFYRSPDGILEATASSFTHTQPLGFFSSCGSSSSCDETDPTRLNPFVRVNHFGSIDIDWDLRVVTVSLRRAANADGHVRPGGDGLAGEVLQSYNIPIIGAT